MTRRQRKRATERRMRRVVSERRLFCRKMICVREAEGELISAARWRANARMWRREMPHAQKWGQQ